ncbi:MULTISPECIES: mechanosensitive ion channel family protein [Gemmobacter]|jgi:small-conductance mechanosensitive channel|uniref:Mechanosensitive ion channel-like protein n=1 Tax=Gemmobacter caeni TaxID=589035 RepID=A0A2T6ANN0_9RHOB|nr:MULTISPECIES: mechanosensitive ion channel domain-containing protein [Gemmobacter]PTX45433.1 mechanosensitive ion channel-like protein [Gemmobacter caeni]TWI93652.1 mechanosensitive ion channel-like protein [Gemmobacter caeni]
MDKQSEFFLVLHEWLDPAVETAKLWLLSPAAWSQFALLIVAFMAARLLTLRTQPLFMRLITPPEGKTGYMVTARLFASRFLPLLLPLFAWAFTALGEEITRSLFGSGAVIAFGKRIFLFLAARIFVREVLRDSFLRLLGRYVLIPVAALYALGILDEISLRLEETIIAFGNIRFSVMALIRGLIAGSLLFWLGAWSNRQSADYIKKQEELRPATRELAVKATEVMIFGASFLLLMSIMGIDLTAVAVLGGALGVGIGLGLQQIAANFVSGIILLLEGQTTVGDYVELDGGEKGTIVRMTARACILETFDGKWIVVPNDHFITSRVVNYSDQGSANRYEAEFSVSYDTDINKVPEIIEAAVAALPFVLTEPDGPDCELRGFGESSVDFAVEYWVNGIDDGKNRFGSPVLFAIWNALKDNGIEMPFPQRVVHIRNAGAEAAGA